MTARIRRSLSGSRGSRRIWSGWWIRIRVGIRGRRCGGRRRASRSSRGRCGRWVTRSWIARCCRLLKAKGYSLQANHKTREGAQHPDRDAQFEHINETVTAAIAAGEPVISVDAKKRELIGDFKAVGREFEPKGKPVEVRGHDFKDKELGHAIPYGVYDLATDEGWVNVGITSDTAPFAVNSIIRWWEHLGRPRYPNAQHADDHRRLRRVQQPAHPPLEATSCNASPTRLGLNIRVCHFPPGTSKWNKIEHRMFSFVSLNWRGKPLESLEVIINLIAATTTSTGLKVYAHLDDRAYDKGSRSPTSNSPPSTSPEHPFHGDWNYTIIPSLLSREP